MTLAPSVRAPPREEHFPPPKRVLNGYRSQFMDLGMRSLMDIVSLIISLISGAVGENIAGAAMKDKSVGNSSTLRRRALHPRVPPPVT